MKALVVGDAEDYVVAQFPEREDKTCYEAQVE